MCFIPQVVLLYVRMHVSGFVFSCFVVKSKISTDTLDLPTPAHNANSLRAGADAYIAKVVVYLWVSTATILRAAQARGLIKLV